MSQDTLCSLVHYQSLTILSVHTGLNTRDSTSHMHLFARWILQHRRDRCQEQVGEGCLSLHQAGLPHQLAPTARYWRHLWYQADRMDHVRWWKSGSEIINNSADQVFCLRKTLRWHLAD